MSTWDLKFIKCDEYKIAGFCFPKAASTSVMRTINTLNVGRKRWNKDTQNVTTSVPSNYKVFVFVRNPYSRIFSSYANLTYFEQLNKKVDISFPDFVVHGLEIPSWKQRPRYAQFRSIVQKLPDHTEIYRFEEFSEKMKEILESVGLLDRYIPHENKTIKEFREKDYKDAYDNKSKFMIKCNYHWDLKYLNYTFDSYGELPTIKELKAADISEEG